MVVSDSELSGMTQVQSDLVVCPGVLWGGEGGGPAERVEGDVCRAEVSVAEDDRGALPLGRRRTDEDGLLGVNSIAF